MSTPHSDISAWIDRQRQKKANTLALRLISEGATEATVRAMTCSDWLALCGRCGIKRAPSAETISLVLLDVRAATKMPTPVSDEDLWRGFDATH
jgi:hypothetical protein